MKVTIIPAKLQGQVAAMPSKSAAHRLLILAALADRPTRLILNDTNEDIEATARCITALGGTIEKHSEGFWLVSPLTDIVQDATLDCGESGSTLRFMLPVAAALGANSTFVGCGRLPQRPLSILRDLLQDHGCAPQGEGLPLTLTGQLTGGDYALPGNVSSQYITGLLLALPLLPGDSRIILTTPLQSAGYVDLTLAALAHFGISVRQEDNIFHICGGQRPRSPRELQVEGDWSGAAFWLAAGALGGEISCTGLDPASGQGDRAMASLLAQMGASVETQGNRFIVSGQSLRAIRLDGEHIPDLVPVLAATAALADGVTHITGAARLRDKESDRLAAICKELTALGAQITELPDGLIITGQPTLDGGQCDGWGDHRIVMALAIAACGCTSPVTIQGAEAVAKSYPSFFEDYNRLGGRAHVV